MARYELVVASDVARIRALNDAGKSLAEIRRLSRRSRWTIRRILANKHPACALPLSNAPTADDIRGRLAPNSSYKAASIAPAIQVGSNSEDGAMIVTSEIVEEKFFNRLIVHFSLGSKRPKEPFLADLANALIIDRVTTPIVEMAAESIIANHTGRFPSVAICRQYCGEARGVIRSAGSANA